MWVALECKSYKLWARVTVVTVAIPSPSWLADHDDWVMWHGLTGSISSWSLRSYVDIMSREWLVSIKVTLDRWGNSFTHFHHLAHHFTFWVFVKVSKTRKTQPQQPVHLFLRFHGSWNNVQGPHPKFRNKVWKKSFLYFFHLSISSIKGCQSCLSFPWLTVSSVILPADLHWGNSMTILFWCCITYRVTGPRFRFWWL